MIPTMILAGLFIGLLRRPWYLIGLIVAAVGWALLVVITDVIEVGNTGDILGAMSIAALNAAVGVGLTRGAALLLRRIGAGIR